MVGLLAMVEDTQYDVPVMGYQRLDSGETDRAKEGSTIKEMYQG